MDVNELAQQVRILQDIEAIKQVKYQYSEGCDMAVNEGKSETFLEVFTPDILWDGGDFGQFKGVDEIKGFVAGMQGQLQFTYHFFTNPVIKVKGDHATGRWHLLAIYTEADGRDTMLAGIENDEYQKIDGRWLIKKLQLTTALYAPFKEGWHDVVQGSVG
jgi:ketosteroid isomerase-like protein